MMKRINKSLATYQKPVTDLLFFFFFILSGGSLSGSHVEHCADENFKYSMMKTMNTEKHESNTNWGKKGGKKTTSKILNHN